MKDLRLLFVAAATAFALLIVTGCTDSVTTPADDPSDMFSGVNANSTDLVLPVQLEDCTLETDLSVVPSPYADAIQEGDRSADDHRDGDRVGRRHIPGPFDRLLRALNLTDEQKEHVGELLKKHHDCVGEALSVLREHVKTIVDGANEARHEVIAKLRAGEITREEARAAIREINARARQAIKDSNIIARVREMLKACDQEFVDALKGMLTPEQLEILQRWLDHRGGGNPGGPGTGSRG